MLFNENVDSKIYTVSVLDEQMNEWMNEWVNGVNEYGALMEQ
jgi:hypothetical protein